MAGHSGRLDREPVRPEENYLATLDDENQETIGAEKKVEKMYGDKEKITAATNARSDPSSAPTPYTCLLDLSGQSPNV